MKDNSEINAPCLAVLGTGSDVGKSIVATALCRILSNRKIRVCPFKAQNMSNNSGVTPEGLEMGRAQIVQAEGARLSPHVDMNPILLKPVTEIGAQVVVLGKALKDCSAAQYHATKSDLFETAKASLDKLRAEYDAVIMEGAGSCAEVNLMPRDIVNLRMAAHGNAPVVLVADIDRGGVFGQIVGTLACLDKAQQDMIAGFVINRFRGDINLFSNGVKWIEEKTGKKVFGVLPWYRHFVIQAEDSVVIENPPGNLNDSGLPSIAVIRIPHISNFTDFDPLLEIEGLEVNFVEKVQDLSNCSAVILPGSKSTRSDLEWLKATGWTKIIQKYVDAGGHVLGICGGFQMLGEEVCDPEGLEGRPGNTPGLGLATVSTILQAPKITTLTKFSWEGASGSGYEIHMGQTINMNTNPLFDVNERNQEKCQDVDGCIAGDRRVLGTYIHGLFDSPEITDKWLSHIGLNRLKAPEKAGLAARDVQYDLLAEHFEKHVDVQAILDVMARGASQ